jgi:hypothetical protein
MFLYFIGREVKTETARRHIRELRRPEKDFEIWKGISKKTYLIKKKIFILWR